MDQTQKLIIFYVLIFVIFYALARLGIIVSYKSCVSIDLIILLMAVIMVGLVYVLRRFLLTEKDFFYFELTGEKKCDGGSYMYSSDPEKQKYCSQFSDADLLQYNCPAGFTGRPLGSWERSPDSNDQWQNEMCSKSFNWDYPHPL